MTGPKNHSRGGRSGSPARPGKGRPAAPTGGKHQPAPPKALPPGRGRKLAQKPPTVLAPTAGCEFLYGRNAVWEALHGRRLLKRLMVAEGIKEDERIRAMLAQATAQGVEIDRVPRLLLDDALRGTNHQGVMLEAGPFVYADLPEIITAPGTVLVLDHLQDPQNFGTLLRTADAVEVAGIVVPADRAVGITPAVVNASSGAVEHLRVAQVANLVQALEDLKAHGRWVLGLAGEKGAVDLFTADLPTPAVLVVGAEGTGLGQRIRTACDLLVALPMRGKVASLNAATAGSIALYDLLRRSRG